MLTDAIIRKAEHTDVKYKISDSKGLYLLISPNKSKYWRLKYRIAGKEKVYAIGLYPEVSIMQAREERDAARKLIAQGIDPVFVRQHKKIERESIYRNTFGIVTHEWHAKKSAHWSDRHSVAIINRLTQNVFPFFETKAISLITAQEILSVLTKIEARGSVDVAHRVLQSINEVFKYAVATGRISHNPAAALKGALKPLSRKRYNHLESIDLPEFYERLKNYTGNNLVRLAIKFLILTFVRTGELREATWDEFNFITKEWRIPGSRMKNGQPHIVPLSTQALKIIEEIWLMQIRSRYVFPQTRNYTKPFTCNAILYALYAMGYHSKATGHGFRATASTILNEHAFRSEVIEKQLAHSERNQVRASYNHAQYMSERKIMMQWWGDYLDEMQK